MDINIHDTVIVKDPEDQGKTLYSHGFAGTVIGFRNDHTVVEDEEGNVYDLDHNEIEEVYREEV